MKMLSGEDLRKAVSGAQWSVSGVIVIAVMVLVTGVPVWEPLTWVATWYVVTVGPVALVLGMYLIWQFPGWDPRKIIVLGVEVFIVFCGVAIFHQQVDNSKASEALAKKKVFLESPEFTTAKDAYELAKAKSGVIVDRLGKIPGDFTTGARDTTTASKEATPELQRARDAYLKVAKKMPPDPETVGAAGLFRIFGKENQDLTLAILLAILGVSYEAVALALAWSPEKAAGTPLQTSQTVSQEAKPRDEDEQEEDVKRKFTAEEYYAAATEGRSDRKVSGRDVVMKKLGMPEREARRLYAECVEKGYIIPAPSTAPRAGQPGENLRLSVAQTEVMV